MRKIKVLYFFPNESFGSVWTVHSHIVRYLDRDRFVPYAAFSTSAEGDPGIGEEDGVIIRKWEFGAALRTSRVAALEAAVHLPFSVAALAKWARREGIDIIHCAEKPRISVVGLLVARYAGARLLLHYHNVPTLHSNVRARVENAVAHRADHTVAVSRFIADKIIGIGISPRKVDAVLNGVNLDKFRPDIDGSEVRREYGIAPGAPLILQLGRICEWKRQADLVRAFAIARRTAPDLRLLLVGWVDPRPTGNGFPDYEAELEQIRREEDLGDSLIIAPGRPDAPQLMRAADIVALPSMHDPCPLVVTEAMASGRPVVGANSGGIPEMVADGETGFLAPPATPEALAEKLARLALDRDLREEMGHAARRRAERDFDEARLAAEFAPIYEKMLGRVSHKNSEYRIQNTEFRIQKIAEVDGNLKSEI